jgi:hypothetical protein
MSKSQTDIFTGFDVTVGSDHAYIHQGKAYVLIGATGSIAAAGVEHVSFKTPALPGGKYIHWRPARLSSTANALAITVTEGAVMTSGTLAVPQNLYRIKKNASQVVAYTGATLTTAGNGGVIYQDAVGSGGASNRSGGDAASGEERVLKPDTTYSITFTNIGASTATVGYYTLFWYEE